MYQIEFFSSQKFQYNKKKLIFSLEEVVDFAEEVIKNSDKPNFEGFELLKIYLKTIKKETDRGFYAFTYMNFGIFKISKMRKINPKSLVNQTLLLDHQNN